MNIKEKTYLKYNIGEINLNCHIDAVHAQRPNSDQYTGEIVLGVIEKIDSSGIISTISRDEMDMNRPRNEKNAPAIDEYRKTLKEVLDSKSILDENKKLNKTYLHLAVHGMSNANENEFEIGTSDGNSCSPEISEWFENKLRMLSTDFVVNGNFSGVNSKIESHRKGDDFNYHGYGDLFNTIQIEINRDWREIKQNELISFFSELIFDFDKTF